VALRAADILVETLVEAEIPYLFTLSGNQILPLFDATIGREIELVHTRHEATAVHMADGWGRLTEQPGIALLTAGPGHCNGVSALYTARMAESPLLLLSGSSPAGKAGLGVFQDIDQVSIAAPLCKAAWEVADPANIGNDVRRALEICRSGRPGPVHLSLPQDVLEATATPNNPTPGAAGNGNQIEPNQVAQILETLNAAERPLILCGPAMSRNERWQEVCAFSRLISVPALPMESPRGINDPWQHGATTCLDKADVVLLLGKRFDFTLGTTAAPIFDPCCKLMQVDADAVELRQHDSLVGTFEADPLDAVKSLSSAIAGRSWNSPEWEDEIKAARSAVPDTWQELRSGTALPMHPLAICDALRGVIDDDAVVVSDGGEVGQWMQTGLDPDCRLINGPSGSIGSSIGLGLAAQLVHPQRRVFVLCGDGTAGYHLLDLDTALRHQLPVVVVVGNDSCWNAEHQLQLKQFGADRVVGCELLRTRYDRVATALGGHGEFVQHPDELLPAIRRAMDSGLPACVNTVIAAAGAPTFR
jgi:acetolactate synthase-1/2/3 large subunit